MWSSSSSLATSNNCSGFLSGFTFFGLSLIKTLIGYILTIVLFLLIFTWIFTKTIWEIIWTYNSEVLITLLVLIIFYIIGMYIKECSRMRNWFNQGNQGTASVANIFIFIITALISIIITPITIAANILFALHRISRYEANTYKVYESFGKHIKFLLLNYIFIYS